MNKSHTLIFLIIFLASSAVKAQDEKTSKFNIIAYGGIGFGIVENENEPNYNLNSNTIELLLNYKFHQKYGIATGLGLNELSGNGFNSEGNFYHERGMLKIPLLLTLDNAITDQLRVIANLGIYGQHIVNDEYRYLNNIQKDVYSGWNFGAQLGVGFVYQLQNNFSAGIHYLGQSDFTDFDTNSNQTISDSQRMNNLSSIGLLFLVDF